ncbi:SpaA isopeptide-forming pilin-related protein [Microbacterium sp. NPDC055988]|uniref:DUF7927 domain-containing protein n=1 Tax=Microbacterium sp. NPDC055988 TaxID=3345671 RepID=UPI0035D61082
MRSPLSVRVRRKVLRAAVALTSIGVGVVVLPSATASTTVADRPAYPVQKPTGYVSALPNSAWNIASDRFSTTAAMPGNEPGTMQFAIDEDSLRWLATRADSSVTDPLMTPNGHGIPLSVNIGQIQQGSDLVPSDVANCLGDDLEVGPAKECYAFAATVTFPRPEIDPIIYVGSGTTDWSVESVAGQNSECWSGWNDFSFTRVNGQPVASDQLSLVDSIEYDRGTLTYSTAVTSLVDGRVVGPEATANRPESCVLDKNPPVSAIQVEGRVSSVSFRIYAMAKITKPLLRPVTLGSVPNATLGFAFASADLSMSKSAPAVVDNRGAIDWELTVANAAGSSDSHGFVVHDAIPADVSDPRIVRAPEGCVLAGHDLRCEVAAPGYAVAQNSTVGTFADLTGGDPLARVPSVLAAGESVTIRLSGTVPASSTQGIVNTATVSGVDIDPDTSNNSSTVTTEVTPSTWTVAKGVTIDGVEPTGGVVSPGDTLTYTVTTSSTRGVVDDVVLEDDLSKVLDHARFVSGSAQLVVDGQDPVAVADPGPAEPATLRTAPFSLQDGQQAALTYQVVVDADAWLATLTNTVTGTADVPFASCDPCSTTSKTGALVQVQKNSAGGDGEVVPVGGSAFEVLADDAGRPGEPLADMPVVAVDAQVGRFTVAGLMPGTYWLSETKAPVGHSLLARPAAFTIGADSAITIVDPVANPDVTVSGDVIHVRDGKAVTLPLTGGGGVAPYFVAGTFLLIIAGLALLAARRHRNSAD